MNIIFVFVFTLFPIFVSTQVFSSHVLGFLVRSKEVYECEPGSFFKTITRSSLIRSYRPDCHAVQVHGEGRNKYQGINWNDSHGLFDADVKRIFNTTETAGKYRMTYSQNGPIIEKTSFHECDGGQITNEQEYLYDHSDCDVWGSYLNLKSVKAFIYVGGRCHSVCWGNVTLK